MTNELEALVVSGKEMDRKLVADMLEPYLRLDKDTCSIRPLESWYALKAYLKILLYLVARKAMMALDFNLPLEAASAGDVANNTGLKTGTVNPALRGLLDDRVVNQDDEGRYFVPNHAIEKIKSMLRK